MPGKQPQKPSPDATSQNLMVAQLVRRLGGNEVANLRKDTAIPAGRRGTKWVAVFWGKQERAGFRVNVLVPPETDSVRTASRNNG